MKQNRDTTLNGHPRKKLASKIDKENRKNKKKGRKLGGSGFDQASTPFHEGILPSQYNAQESALERVGRSKRRTEW
jgi:hypothetical protein